MTAPLFWADQSELTNDDFLTPRWVFDMLDIAFDLDVAAPPWDTNVPAARKYTKAIDGLAQPWEGRVWMNPPYSKATPWADRFIAHGHGIALLPWVKANWVLRMWKAADAIALPPVVLNFERDISRAGMSKGSGIPFMVMFAAFGGECVEAIKRMGRIR